MTELTDKISNWLKEQGYPLEMAIAQVLHSRAFYVRQSDYYTDPDSGESREIDVIGSKQWDMDNILCRVSLVIECKTSRDKPWLLFGSDGDPLADRARVVQRSSSLAGKILLSQLRDNPAIAALPLFQVADIHGYGLTQAFTSGNDAAYKAVMAASKAAHSIGHAANEVPEPAGVLSQRRHYAEILFPTVVVGGKLFRCTMDKQTGNLELKDIPRGVLVWKNPVVGYPHSIVHIVTEDDFPSFVDDAYRTIHDINAAIEGSARAAYISQVGIVTARKRSAKISTLSLA